MRQTALVPRRLPKSRRLRESVSTLCHLALALVLANPAVVRAAQDDPEAPPPLDQPEDFSGAIGTYRIDFRATPTEVAVEDPLVLTVSIAGKGSKKYQPERAKLRIFPPEMARDFFVQPLPDQDRHRAGPDEDTWEFVYRLRPRRLGVQRIPALRFVYYDPALRRYQPARTRGSLPLKVTPAAKAKLKDAVRLPPAPERFYELVTGPAVLARSTHAGEFYPLLLGCLVLAPPAVCVGWYALRRRLDPAAGWRARRRRSRAAREALAALQAVQGETAGAQSAAILSGYLRRRLGLAGAEPTPVEVAAYLKRAGVSADMSDRVADFLRACDAARFAPTLPAGTPALAADARVLIHALEAELCTSRAC